MSKKTAYIVSGVLFAVLVALFIWESHDPGAGTALLGLAR